MNYRKLPDTSVITLLLSGLLLATQTVIAHDLFDSEPKENTIGDVNLRIYHGCDEKPIIAQSILFPTVNPILTAYNAKFKPVKAPADLSEVIYQGSYAGLMQLVQDNRIFEVQSMKRDALGNGIGFVGKKGKLSVGLQGRLPFEFTAASFVETSCVKQVYLDVAIADICDMEKPQIKAGKVNLFIPDNGSQYANLGKAEGIHGIGEPSRLGIVRDLKTNPLAKSCHKGLTLFVTPSAEDVDANLGFPGWHY